MYEGNSYLLMFIIDWESSNLFILVINGIMVIVIRFILGDF